MCPDTTPITPRRAGFSIVMAALAATALLLLLIAGLLMANGNLSSSENGVARKVSGPAMAFEPNTGQADEGVRFTARSPGVTLAFRRDSVQMALYTRSLDGKSAAANASSSARGLAQQSTPVEWQEGYLTLVFAGADPAQVTHDSKLLPSKVNYFLGDDPGAWRTGLPTYSQVRYESLYPGIDLTYSGQAGALKSNYYLGVGADPNLIRWRYKDAQSVIVQQDGALQITLPTGSLGEKAPGAAMTVREDPPVAWQVIDGRRRTVEAHYVVDPDGLVGFDLGDYDKTAALTIDPYIYFSTFLGGFSADQLWDATADKNGNTYIAGYTASADFPTSVNAFQERAPGSGDGFVAKFNSAGDLVYATYLGGSYMDMAVGIAADDDGNAYVMGMTGSTNFPLWEPFQAVYAGGWDAFVTKLNPQGDDIVFSSYLGGSGQEIHINAGIPGGVAVDEQGYVYISGDTQSSDFPIVNAIQPTRHGQDAFVTKLHPSGLTAVYSTYLGGTNFDVGYGIAADAQGNAVLVGETGSLDFPTANAQQWGCAPRYGGGCWDIFVTRLNASGQTLLYSTYLGGDDYLWPDRGFKVALDSSGAAYVTGITGSYNFPTLNAYQSYPGGWEDAFVTKYSAAGVMQYSTYLGGNNTDSGHAITISPAGEIYVGGSTISRDFPLANPIQGWMRGNEDAFLSKLSSSGQTLLFSTYLGGSEGTEDYGIRGMGLDSAGNLYVGTMSAAPDFPLVNPYQPTNHGSYDAVVVRISDAPPPSPTYSTITPSVTPTPCAVDYTVATSNGAVIEPGVTDTGNHCNDCTTTIALPFPYRFYGSTYTSARVSDNGNLQFTGSENWQLAGCLPSIIHGPTIFALWDDLLTNQPGQGIFTSVSGQAPNRVFNIEWRACFYLYQTCGGDANFEIRLFEGQTHFEVIYGTLGNPGTYASVGAQSSDDPSDPYTQYMCRAGGLYQGLKLTFTLPWCAPQPSATATATHPPTRTPRITATPTDTRTPTATNTRRATVTPLGTQNPAGTATTTRTTSPTRTPTQPTGTIQPTVTVAPCTISFVDVSPGSTFYPYVLCLACREIIVGYGDGTFRPNDNMTRGQAAKIISNAAGYNEEIPLSRQTFSDVPPGSTFWVYIERVKLHGVIGGYPDGTYRPASNVTRGQIAKLASEARGYNEEIPPSRQTFSDVPPGSTFWVFVERLVLHQAVGGYPDGTYRPASNVTRGQASKIITLTFLPQCVTP